MVDEREFLKQYNYKATSNLVLQQDRGSHHQRSAGTGEVSALKTDELPGRMGDKAVRPGEKSEELAERLERRRQQSTHGSAGGAQVVDSDFAQGSASGGVIQATTGLGMLAPDMNVVDVANEHELDAGRSGYVPTTQVAQKAFEALLALVMSKLGDQPRDLLRSAADEALAILKDQRLQESERKKHIEEMLAAKLSADEFARLSMLGRQIKDFGEGALGKEVAESHLPDANELSEGQGVAVVFDDDEIDEGNATPDEELDEVVDVHAVMDDSDAEVEDSEAQSVPTFRGMDGDREDKQALRANQTRAMAADAQHSSKDEEDFSPHKLDGYWLQRTLSAYYKDAHDCQRVAEEVLNILSRDEDDRTCENRLVMLLEFEKYDFISVVLKNRAAVVYCTKLARAEGPSERKKVELEMKESDKGRELLRLLRLEGGDVGGDLGSLENANSKQREGKKKDLKRVRFGSSGDGVEDTGSLRAKRKRKFPLRKLDLDSLSFQKGGRLMTARDCKLPTGSEHIENKDFEEWHIPAVRNVSNENDPRLISIDALPEWCRPAFPNIRNLNRMQSSVFSCAFGSDENMLLCAPTGAGKTNVAVLTILRAVQSSGLPVIEMAQVEQANLNKFKVVYVAPMKALVSEVVENLGKRLGNLGMVVRELTGDVNLSKQEIDETHVIVTTPEKWDIITRKSIERAFTSLVRLLIVDEIHLLHDERGPVLEAIVARTTRSVESLAATTRIVGLSATLPNYKDVGAFLRVDPQRSLFYFNSSYRPCPLQQCYVGITAKKALKRFQLMNELTYEKVKLQLQSSNQVIVFVHSRKETSTTCQYLINRAIEEEEIDQFMKPGSASYEIIQSEITEVNGRDLGNLMEHGLATHHAGMTRSDRNLVEALFEKGHIKVLVSTATLAWGVNLPAHAVIIKGTQVYSPQHGRWVALSSMDVMQMMGRAGRPQFDNQGEGIIITSKADVLYYLSVLNDQLPIESQFVARLVDMLNAEVASGSISSIEEGALWLCYTYLYVRMLKNPTMYGISVDEHHMDSKLERRRAELAHAAASQLHRSGLVTYDKRSGAISGTNLGLIAADYYVSHETMSMYVKQMKPTTTDVDLLRLFSLSGEFRHMRVRDEEKVELARLAERLPIPVKESLDESTAKVNVLLQSYISNLALDGLALKADMVYVAQSADRLARALLHVAMQMRWAVSVDKCLRLCKAVASRQWTSQTPLRQFRDVIGDDVLHRIERKDISFERYYDLTVAGLGELLRNPELGRTVHRLVHSLPRLELDAKVRPLSRSTIEVELTLSPDFRFDRKVHGSGEAFWILVEDADSEVLLHSELFFLRRSLASDQHVLTFTVQLTTPQPPQYYVKCISDRWIVPETNLPISFRGLVLPEKFAPHTKLLEMRPLSVEKAFQVDVQDSEDQGILDIMAYREGLAELRRYYGSRFRHFPALPTQLFQTLFESDVNAVVATLPDAERTICAELCLARLFCRKPTSTAIWIAARGEVAVEGVRQFLAAGIGKRFGLHIGTFVSYSGTDLSVFRSSGSVVVTTSERWDLFSRKWRQKRERRILRKISLVVVDGIHSVAEQGGRGAALEIACSRMRYIAADATESGSEAFRIAALSDPISNAMEIGHWLGAPPSAVFSFHPRAVVKGLQFEVVASARGNGRARFSPAGALVRPVYAAIRRYVGDGSDSILVFVPSRKIARSMALEIVSAAAQGGNTERFLHSSASTAGAQLDDIGVGTLKECVALGVGYVHQGMKEKDRDIVEGLYKSGAVQVLVATSNYAWQTATSRSRLIIVAGTAREDEGGLGVRRAEYARTDLLKMICSVKQDDASDKRVAVVVTEAALLEHYERHCMEPLPVESQLRQSLSEHINAEIAAGVIETKQDAIDYMTWTFFYRRLPKNPNYYGVNGLSHLEISNHLSEMVDGALSELEASKCVATEGDEDVALGALNLGIIASHYYLRHVTVELFASSVSPRTKLRGLLDILSLASEFSDVPVRVGEEETIQTLSQDQHMSLEDGSSLSFSSPYVKAHVLLRAQLSRTDLTTELAQDLAVILPIAIRLLRAMVDVIASAGWLKPALAAIELSQMLIQGIWDSDPPLMQLPFVNKGLAAVLQDEYDVADIFAFLDMEPKARSEVLQGLSKKQILDIASACQKFPNLQDIEIQSIEEAQDGYERSITRVVVRISRNDEDEAGGGNGSGLESNEGATVPLVVAPRYPEAKEEGWWVIIGDVKTNSLLTLKHVVLKQTSLVKLEFSSPATSGKYGLTLYLLSDSYVDCDQEESFETAVTAVDISGNKDDEKDIENAETGQVDATPGL